ncbi:MAG: TauD/TfdA family dioxygenase [Rhodobacteraceae bacterium]|nr:TauD/TfdA family dioxygenase [Paracoccaceae bacterium]
MKDLGPLPLSPDFAEHPAGPGITTATPEVEGITVTFADGASHHFNRYYLRENEVADGVINPITRESEFLIESLPDDLTVGGVEIDGNGALVVTWGPDGHASRHHPGWLHAIATGLWRPGAALPARESWDAASMPEPVSFDGPAVLENDDALTEWLIATEKYGLARLRGLPDIDGTVQRVAERIGTVRSSNFGFLFSVESKPDPDSNAYRSVALPPHTDLGSREVQPGLQLLHCRENTCSDGWSTMVDGMRLSEHMRDTDPDAYEALTTLNWVTSNRHRTSDYRWSGPIIDLDADGVFAEMRNTSFLRAEPDMDAADVPRAYAALRKLMGFASDPAFVCRYPFATGDLVIFDNRRVLHGRDSFNPQGGVRRLQGCYLDRDELYSRLRVLAREARSKG